MLSPCSVCPAWTTELGEKEDCGHVYDRWYRNIESLWFSLQLLLEKGFTAELENILQCSRAHACIITEGLFWFHIPFFFTRSQRQVVWTHIKEGLTFAYAGGGRLKHSSLSVGKKKFKAKICSQALMFIQTASVRPWLRGLLYQYYRGKRCLTVYAHRYTEHICIYKCKHVLYETKLSKEVDLMSFSPFHIISSPISCFPFV